ncbi:MULTISPECIES: hypothetical protein [Thermodesulfobacterium]|jgi:hypothetical protein|uniref:DUF6922 domain-containing protein n=1 Tax=Thermodesulfobacterium TaxID=1740 RepID=UPI000749CC40|nr:hypothetical protein [Thermodesulfobacterium sp.]KUJ98114.1 MAG: hypothetical protein XD42_0201 [Thermodesulfobacterium sp. 37_54]KUK19760.1 MAG: hypothetical protein XD55_0145 [Thermodesulfobacterium commune]MBZ4682263.1 hypothetical protein [Thermodesulfobacterium sp.]HBT04354.1 hypothetical protein [Thermodesulfobacterium commune]HCE79410.1 hypothetical protein [Thermodesulfobacterium commune]
MDKKEKNFNKLKPLFWEHEWNSVKKNLNSPFVIARVLEIGNPEQFKIFVSVVGDDKIIKFLQESGERLLSRKSLNFWRIYYDKKAKRRA